MAWITMEVICEHCGYEHVSVHPADVHYVECPNCGQMTFVWYGH